MERVRTSHLILFSLAFPCVAASFPEYPAKPANEYATVIVKSGLAVAVVPVEDTEDQHKYFGIDLRSKGYVPVFLVIENRTSGDSFLLKKEGLMYSPAGRSGSTLPNPANPSKADKALEIAGALPTIYTFMATIAASKAKELRQNLLKTELQSATLSPGQSIHGFVFVPAHRRHALRDKIQLTIPFTRSGSSESAIIDLVF